MQNIVAINPAAAPSLFQAFDAHGLRCAQPWAKKSYAAVPPAANGIPSMRSSTDPFALSHQAPVALLHWAQLGQTGGITGRIGADLVQAQVMASR